MASLEALRVRLHIGLGCCQSCFHEAIVALFGHWWRPDGHDSTAHGCRCMTEVLLAAIERRCIDKDISRCANSMQPAPFSTCVHIGLSPIGYYNSAPRPQPFDFYFWLITRSVGASRDNFRGSSRRCSVTMGDETWRVTTTSFQPFGLSAALPPDLVCCWSCLQLPYVLSLSTVSINLFRVSTFPVAARGRAV